MAPYSAAAFGWDFLKILSRLYLPARLPDPLSGLPALMKKQANGAVHASGWVPFLIRQKWPKKFWKSKNLPKMKNWRRKAKNDQLRAKACPLHDFWNSTFIFHFVGLWVSLTKRCWLGYHYFSFLGKKGFKVSISMSRKYEEIKVAGNQLFCLAVMMSQ